MRIRKLDELADKMEALLAAEKEHDVQLFKSLCEIFVSEVNEEDARQAMQHYKKSNSQQVNSDEEVERLKVEIEALKNEIEQLKAELFEKEQEKRKIAAPIIDKEELIKRENHERIEREKRQKITKEILANESMFSLPTLENIFKQQMEK